LALALAVVLAPDPAVLLLDEPTRGLDYQAKQHLMKILANAAQRGRTIVLATHDVELAAELSTRTVIVADGEVVADGPTRRIITSSPMFAPQIAKTMSPLPLLTVADVAIAMTALSDIP
jgi:energy-coupling factor transport system ATP-binding protein